MHAQFERVEVALKDLQQGKMIILTDNPGRENEGDIVFPAEKITPAVINFMLQNCSGIICLSLNAAQVKKLNLAPMVPLHENTSQRCTPFTVSIEAKSGVTTGVSAADRATTILTAVRPDASSDDLAKPGHIFPLQAKEGGVLERGGHTEGSLDLMHLAGLKPAAVLCEVMNMDGSMTKGAQLAEFAAQHQLNIVSIDDIIAYRYRHENLIEEESSTTLPLENYGLFNFTVVKEKITQQEHIILSKENKDATKPLLVRVHSSCLTGDLFGSNRCDCNQQLHYSLKRISEEGGILIYLQQEGRGIGLLNKAKAYALQEQGLDTIEANQELGFPADARNYYIAATILRNKNISAIRLLTNNPQKIAELEKYSNTTITQEVMPAFCNEHNKKYLRTKKEKLHHTINSHLL